MSYLLCELEIDAACWEFLASRIYVHKPTVFYEGEPQPIIALLDRQPEDDDPDWDELTARAAKMCVPPGAESCMDVVERVLGGR